MIIIMLAGAMTITMLIATAFALHNEAQRARARVPVASIESGDVRNAGSDFGRLSSVV